MKTLLTSLLAAAAFAAPALAQDLAVTNGRVVTNTGAGIIDSGTVVVRDGAIVDVGADVDVPDVHEALVEDVADVTTGVDGVDVALIAAEAGEGLAGLLAGRRIVGGLSGGELVWFILPRAAASGDGCREQERGPRHSSHDG